MVAMPVTTLNRLLGYLDQSALPHRDVKAWLHELSQLRLVEVSEPAQPAAEEPAAEEAE